MNEIKSTVVGELRPSQLLYTFGVGALLDLPHMSVLVMGLDDWEKDRVWCEPITEERLLAAVRLRLGPSVKQLLKPPIDPDKSDFADPFKTPIGVPVTPFPRWARCPKCNRLAPLDSGFFEITTKPYQPDRTRFVHKNCNKGREPDVLPVRFVVACKNGHLNDFPWVAYVHGGVPCDKPRLLFREYGVSGEPSDIEVRCETCDRWRRMGDALNRNRRDVLPPCRAWHPHLRTYYEDDCSEKDEVKVTLLGASNGWFPVTLSAISLPVSTDKVEQLVEDNWAALLPVTSLDILKAFRQTPMLAMFAEFSDGEIWRAIVKKREGADDSPTEGTEDLKPPEWAIFSRADENLNTDDFKLRETGPPRGYETLIEKTVLVERIREVITILGFTRIEAPGDATEEENILQRMAPLSRKEPAWLPASEVRGEGVFIQFNEDAVRQWTNQPAVIARSQTFFTGHCAWRRMRGVEPNDAGFPGMRYILLHSFAHALMRQLSLECGYTAASVRERVYSSDGPENPMAGVLIYTAASDSEGTLGGLVSLGESESLGRHIDQALEQMRLCASDPLCAEHSPSEDAASIHGAACHACLFAPETSCERGNRYLDRAVLVPTFSTENAAFF